MKRIHHLVRRHEPKGHFVLHLKSGLGAMAALASVGGLAVMTGLPFLLAPFGATAVLLFGQPRSPLAQPANVFGGYAIAAIIGCLSAWLFPGSWFAAAIAVGLSIAAMSTLRVTHPPAGAIPLVAFASIMNLPELVAVVLSGSLLMIVIALLHHLIPPRQQYPLPVDQL
jgi:CBS-domain-containing membrane protein